MQLRKSILIGGALLALTAAPAAAWTGCGLGIGAAAVIGSLDFGAPIDISSSGQRADVAVSCDMQMGTSPIVVGAFVRYGMFYGDLKTIGVKNELDIGLRAGALASPSAFVYGHVAGSRMHVDGLGDVNGIKFGPGVEVKLAGSPLYLNLEYAYGIPDVSEWTSADVRTHEFRVGMAWKFFDRQPKSIFTNETDPPPPKQRSPK